MSYSTQAHPPSRFSLCMISRLKYSIQIDSRSTFLHFKLTYLQDVPVMELSGYIQGKYQEFFQNVVLYTGPKSHKNIKSGRVCDLCHLGLSMISLLWKRVPLSLLRSF